MGSVKLEDLTPEAYEKIMKEAKEKVQQETSREAAIAMYKAKKKEFINDTIEEIVETIMRKMMVLGADVDCRKYACYSSFKNQIGTRYTSMLNFFLRIWMAGPNSAGSYAISAPDEWAYFTSVGTELADFMIAKCMGDGFSHDQLEVQEDDNNETGD